MELGANSKLHQHYRKAQYASHDREHARKPVGERDPTDVIKALQQAK
jgi:hypothetical protein